MTVQAQTPFIVYTADGVTTVFAYPFRILDGADLKVFVAGVLQAGYGVDNVGAQGGGNVTFLVAPLIGLKVLLARQVVRVQPVDYQPFDPFPAETHERALDRLTMAAQEDGNVALRALRVPLDEDITVVNLVLPHALDRAGKFVGFDPAGNVITSPLAGLTVHADLLGLAADDHLQYHTDARGDARYLPLGAQHDTLTGLGDDDHLQYHTDARGDARYRLLIVPIDHSLLLNLAADDHLQYHTDARGDARYMQLGAMHSTLTGLGADDHPQYHNDARGDARYVKLTGSTMTGALLLSADPLVAAGAATKNYVDNFVAGAKLTNYVSDATGDAQPTVHQAWNAQANALGITRLLNEIFHYRWPSVAGAVYRYMGNQVGPAGWASVAADWPQVVGITEAPSDGQTYGRNSGLWINIDTRYAPIAGPAGPFNVTTLTASASVVTPIVQGGAASSLTLGSGGINRWIVNAQGHFLAFVDNTYDIGGAGVQRPRNVHVAGTVVAASASISSAIVGSAVDIATHLIVRGITNAVRIGTIAGGAVVQGVDQTGSGSHQPLAVGGSTLAFTISGVNKWVINAALDGLGHLTSEGDNVRDIGAVASGRPRTGYFGTSVRIDGADAGNKLRITGPTKGVRIGTTAGFGSIEGIDNTELTYQPLFINASELQLATAGTVRWFVTNTDIVPAVTNTYDLGRSGFIARNVFSGAAVLGGAVDRYDTLIVKGLTKALYLGTDPTSSKVSGVSQDGSTFQPLFISALEIRLLTSDVQRWALQAAGHIVPIADNTYDLGVQSNRIRSLFVGTNIIAGNGSGQYAANIYSRVAGASIEFGHNNPAGYACTLGAEANSGKPFLAFNAGPGTVANTFKTLGLAGAVLRGDLAGGFNFLTVPLVNADDQPGVLIANITSAGNLIMPTGIYSPTVYAGYNAANDIVKLNGQASPLGGVITSFNNAQSAVRPLTINASEHLIQINGSPSGIRINAAGAFKATNSGSLTAPAAIYHELNSNTGGAPVLFVTNHDAVNPHGMTVYFAGTPNLNRVAPFLRCVDSALDRINLWGDGGATFTGRVDLPASSAGTAPLRVPHGVVPAAPVDGEIWTTAIGVFARVAGATQTLGIPPGGTGSTAGFLAGFGLANNVADATNDIDIAAGKCRSTGDTADIALGAAMTKQLDTVWAAGSGVGMRASGAAIADTTYHIFAIRRPDTLAVDIAADTSVTGANIAGNTNVNFTQIRRIGSILREAGVIVGFIQDGDVFTRKTLAPDVNALLNPGNVAVTQALSVPVGLRVQAVLCPNVVCGGAGLRRCLLTDLAGPDVLPADGNMNFWGGINAATSISVVGEVRVFTNTLRQVRYRFTGSDGVTTFSLMTRGWLDTRGRNEI